MKIYYLFIILFILNSSAVMFSQKQNTADFYISTLGSDEWSGKLPEPNKDGTDGPFATLGKAKLAVRELKKTKSDSINVYIRGGLYNFDNTVIFDLNDSGNDSVTIIYSAYPNEKPVFSGGKPLLKWSKVKHNIPGLPSKAKGEIYEASIEKQCFTLYDSEGLLKRASTKKFIPLPGGNTTTLICPSGIVKNWSNPSDLDIFIRPWQAWMMNILPVKSLDYEKGVLYTYIQSTYPMNRLHFLPKTENCWIENVINELDEPGEWVYNSKEKKIYLWPRNKSDIYAGNLMEIIRVEGDIDFDGPMDIPVKNIVFKGITFKHGERYTVNQNDKGLQHDWDFLDKDNSLVRFRGTKSCTIENCIFTDSGSGAIRVDLYGQNNKIIGNRIFNIGGTGILLCGYGLGSKNVNMCNTIYNNHIYRIGEIYWHSPAIFISQSGNNRISNNLIHDTNYSGIIVSGFITHFLERTEGRELVPTIRHNELYNIPQKPTLSDIRQYLHSNNNIIEYNEIHHVMKKLGDGNAVYIRGAGSNNVIRYNYIHDMVAPMHMQCALRTDGGQTDTRFEKNIIYRCTSQGIMIKLNNQCINNFVIDVLEPPRGYYLSLREGPMTGAVIKNNIFYSTKRVVDFINELKVGEEFSTEDARGRAIAYSKDAFTDNNIYYCKEDNSLGEEFIKKQNKSGVDIHSKASDPMFIDLDNCDFGFQIGSPALKMGIESIDVKKIGLRK